MRTRIGRSLAFLSTLSLLLSALAASAPTLAQSGDDCTLSVKPRNGGPGTEFVFSGAGYAPSRLVLKREGGPTKTVQVTPGDSDGFTIRLVAGQNDAGAWTATAVEPDVCRATASFRVGLPPTSTIASTDEGLRGAALAGFAALGALFVAASVFVLPRVTRNARTR